MRTKLMYLAVGATLVLAACGSVSGTENTTSAESTVVETQATGDPVPSPTESTDPTPIESTRSTDLDNVTPPEEQIPAEATAVDDSMSVALPDDWRYAEELRTPYSVFSWTKEDATQNLSIAPLGPWTQIVSPEIYVDQLEANGNLGDATLTLEGDMVVDGYEGFWLSVEGPGYVANIYYINVNGGIKEITANALHKQGLAEVDRLVQTIDFH